MRQTRQDAEDVQKVHSREDQEVKACQEAWSVGERLVATRRARAAGPAVIERLRVWIGAAYGPGDLKALDLTIAAQGRDLSLKEAAALLRVHQDTLLNWIDAGRLIAFQPGGRGTQIRIPQSQIEEAQRRRKGAA